jgi:hypothetical protein
MTPQLLVKRIESYCAAYDVAESTFGRLSVNDGKLVSRLRAGGSITLDTLSKIETALAAPPNTDASPTDTPSKATAA